MKKVYISIGADHIHPRHMNIIKKGVELGEVTLGLLTDTAIVAYQGLPLLEYEQRKMIFENVKGVARVIPQESVDCTPNLRELRPNYVLQDGYWSWGSNGMSRDRVNGILAEWGGELINTSDPSSDSTATSHEVDTGAGRYAGTTPGIRRRQLRRLLDIKPIVRVLEAHSGLSGLIVENTSLVVGNQRREFDGIWMSSLTDSTTKGKPDIELVDWTSRLETLHQILEVTTKPIIVDGDTGGLPEHFVFLVKTLERLGVSAVIIEDKVGLKKNSLFGTDVPQTQALAADFCRKIKAGKSARVTNDFMIIARIESLILKMGVDDAIHRARCYIDAGADALMIHSKNDTPDEILEFCHRYRDFEIRVPLVAVPSTYNVITESDLHRAGVNIVIYANQLLRAAYPAMVDVALSILEHDRSLEATEKCMPISAVLELIPGTK